MNIEFMHQPEFHRTVCTITKHDRHFIGEVICQPEDYEFENKLTGEALASLKACIKAIKEQIFIARHELKTLNHVYSIIKNSKDFNYKSKENYVLRRQIKLKEKHIKFLQSKVDNLNTAYHDTVTGRADLYKSLREMRAKADVINK